MRKTVFVCLSLLFVTGARCEDPGDTPTTPDAAPPAPSPDASPPAPVDAAPITDAGPAPTPDAQPDAAPPASVNQHTDRYDPDGDRVLITHCTRGAVLAFDLESNTESVIADQWPFAEENRRLCPVALARRADNTNLHVVVERSYDDANGDSCRSKVLVTVSAQGEVTPVRVLDLDCCDDCGGHERYLSPLIDDAHDRVVLLETDCGSDECDSNLIGIAPDTGERSHVFQIFRGGNVYPEPLGRDLALDPRAPDSRVLALIKQDDTVDVIDVDSGAREVLVTVQIDWDGVVMQPALLSLDAAQKRLFVIGHGTDGYGVIGIDIETGAQTLVYDGTANEQGDAVTCSPQAAFDSLRNRLLMFVNPRSGCTEGLYAVDLANGTLARLPYTPVSSAAH